MGFMEDLANNQLQNMDEEQAQALLENLDEEQVDRAIQMVVDNTLIPELERIRERAISEQDTEKIREQIESLDPEVREEMFYDTLGDLVGTLVACRQNPREGMKDLKFLLRDPYTVEALLLIFENDDHIDKEYTAQLKDFAATHIHWVGAMVLPEMYTPEERERVQDRVGMEPGDESGGAPGG